MPANKPLKVKFLSIPINVRHRLFFPLVFLGLQMLVYLFFFSEGGYFNHLHLSEEKAKILEKIEILEAKKREQEAYIQILEKEPKSKTVIHALFPFEAKGEILYVEDYTQTIEEIIPVESKTNKIKNTYIIVVSLLQLCLFMIFYWKKDKIQPQKPSYKRRSIG